jgi:hypothetical protein
MDMKEIASDMNRTTNCQLLAIDPGTEQSGWCVIQFGRVAESGVAPNQLLLGKVLGWKGALAMEMVSSYGMPVGREVFETVLWIGRFQQAYEYPEVARLIYRRDVKLYLCGSPKAKDANIRQALLDMFPRTGGGKTPQVGTKSKPGPLHGVSSHAWAALAVGVTALNLKEAA